MSELDDKFELIVNGCIVETAAATIADLLVERELRDAKVATALNGEFIPAARRGTTHLSAGDRVEIVSPRQGG
jgi:sulfur carrier protein